MNITKILFTLLSLFSFIMVSQAQVESPTFEITNWIQEASIAIEKTEWIETHTSLIKNTRVPAESNTIETKASHPGTYVFSFNYKLMMRPVNNKTALC